MSPSLSHAHPRADSPPPPVSPLLTPGSTLKISRCYLRDLYYYKDSQAQTQWALLHESKTPFEEWRSFKEDDHSKLIKKCQHRDG